MRLRLLRWLLCGYGSALVLSIVTMLMWPIGMIVFGIDYLTTGRPDSGVTVLFLGSIWAALAIGMAAVR